MVGQSVDETKEIGRAILAATPLLDLESAVAGNVSFQQSASGRGAKFGPGPVAAPFPFIWVMQSPSAHIATQGKTLNSKGAMPAATSQLQFRPRPATVTAPAIKRSPRRLPHNARRAATRLREREGGDDA
jgi:hypothetical protein